MKTIFPNVMILSFTAILILSGCKKNEEEPMLTDQQKATRSLSSKSSWHVTSVISKPDNNIPDDDLMGLQLSFKATGTDVNITPGSFSATGALDYLSTQTNATWSWSGSGVSTVSLTNASTNQLTNVILNPSTENATSLQITFNVNIPNGRIKNIGSYKLLLE